MSVNQATLGPVPEPKKELTGIGGWLILVAVGQALAPLVQLGLAGTYLTSPDFKSALENYPILALGEILLNVGMFLFMVWCSYNFFMKKRRWPTLYIWELWLVGAIQIADWLWVSSMLNVPMKDFVTVADGTGLLKIVVMATIWTAYTLKSRRVKNTFVN